jgi:hypothetical protein
VILLPDDTVEVQYRHKPWQGNSENSEMMRSPELVRNPRGSIPADRCLTGFDLSAHSPNELKDLLAHLVLDTLTGAFPACRESERASETGAI